MRLELSVKIGKIFKATPFGNAQNGVLCGMKCLGSRIESILPQKNDKGLTGHLPEPPHKMVGAAPAKRGSIRYTDGLAVMSRKPLQYGSKPLGVYFFGRRQCLALCDQER